MRQGGQKKPQNPFGTKRKSGWGQDATLVPPLNVKLRQMNGVATMILNYMDFVISKSSSTERFVYLSFVAGFFQPACLSFSSGSTFLNDELLAPPLLRLCVAKSEIFSTKGERNFLKFSRAVV